MPPEIALLLCLLFIFYILFLDRKHNPNISLTLWIPLIWMMIIGSRNIGAWLNIRSSMSMAEARLQGNPVDQFFYSILIFSELFILYRRKIDWSQILKRNIWLFLLFLYWWISIIWSDFPIAIFRKLIKSSGDFIMVLGILTDTNPIESTKTMLRRCTYVLIPLSILLIKYYPHLGRKYNPWSGMTQIAGVTSGKNTLGGLCLICGLFFFYDLFISLHKPKMSVKKIKLLVNIFFLLMVLWLLKKSNSSTSLLCFIIGTCIIICLGFPFIKRNIRSLGAFVLIIPSILLILQLPFNIIEIIVSRLGRDITFTGRTTIWKEVLGMVTNPLIGTGYDSFWQGDRLKKICEELWVINQAHNGYIETYLNLGLIGVFLLIGVIISALSKINKTLLFDFDFGRFQFSFLVVYLLHNFTEASFKGFNIGWFVFLFVVMDIP